MVASAEWILSRLLGVTGTASLEHSLGRVLAQYQAAVAAGLTTVLRAVVIPVYAAGAVAWTNMPLARTELFGGTLERIYIDLTGYSQFRVSANVAVAGTAGARLFAEYSLDNSAWVAMDDLAFCPLATPTGLKFGILGTIPP